MDEKLTPDVNVSAVAPEESSPVPDEAAASEDSALLESDERADDDFEGEDDAPEGEPASFFDQVAETTKDFFVNFNEHQEKSMLDPDESSIVKPKKLYIAVAASAFAAVVLFFFLAWFLCYFNYYTTDITVDEFVDGFNGIARMTVSSADVSGSDASGSDAYGTPAVSPDLVIESPFPMSIVSYTDVLIPSDAKIGSGDGVSLIDDCVQMSADTRLGKIKSLKLAINLDALDALSDNEVSNIVNYYLVCLGKAYAALETPLVEGLGEQSFTYTTEECFSIGYSLFYYGYMYMQNGQPTYEFDIGNTHFLYNFSAMSFEVYPVNTIIMDAPKVYNFFDGIFGEREVELEPTESDPDPDVSGSDASPSDVVSPSAAS